MRVIIAAATLAVFTLQARADNDVIPGPGFAKNQRSAHPLTYRLPKGWQEDAEAASKAGVAAVLVPAGKTLSKADAAITIAFQRKDAAVPGLATLKGFFAVDMQNTLAQFPDTEGVRWQPRGLDPDSVQFMSIELRPTGPRASSPARVLFVDAGDGFYTITLTVSGANQFADARYDQFFDSLALR